MNKKTVEQLSDAVTALRANGFDSLAEAAVFCVAARATVSSKPSGISEISRATELPISTTSRLVWNLSQRGFLEYAAHSQDRRVKLVHAKLEAFK